MAQYDVVLIFVPQRDFRIIPFTTWTKFENGNMPVNIMSSDLPPQTNSNVGEFLQKQNLPSFVNLQSSPLLKVSASAASSVKVTSDSSQKKNVNKQQTVKSDGKQPETDQSHADIKIFQCYDHNIIIILHGGVLELCHGVSGIKVTIPLR
jgi:hypothetical protein